MIDFFFKILYRVVLGDVVVFFDFGFFVEFKRKNRFYFIFISFDVVWFVYIVFGNGDVVIVYIDLFLDFLRLVFLGGLIDNVFVIV